jgi:hypothetical protein
MVLTNSDFKGIKEFVNQAIEENETLVRKEDIKHLPTKDEFYDKMDEVMGELKSIRDETTAQSGINRKINDQEIRIEKVEKKLGIQPAL